MVPPPEPLTQVPPPRLSEPAPSTKTQETPAFNVNVGLLLFAQPGAVMNPVGKAVPGKLGGLHSPLTGVACAQAFAFGK